MKIQNFKRKLLIFSLIAICTSLLAYGSLAYFTKIGETTNVITLGNIQIEIKEEMLEDGSLVPFVDQMNVMPATTVSKIVKITNTGGQTAWLRVSVEKIIELVDPEDKEVDLSLVSIDFNETDWTYKDGYYYYNKPLQPEETTEALFKTVTFTSNMSNIYQDCKVTINVKAFATQYANNGSNVFEAAGWPEMP